VGDGGGRAQLGDVVHCCWGGHTESAIRPCWAQHGGGTERLDVDGLVAVASAHPLQHALIDRTWPAKPFLDFIHLFIYFMDLNYLFMNLNKNESIITMKRP
jgi:hypothetical protein